MSQLITFDEIKFDRNVFLEDLLNTPDDSDTGYFIDFDLTYPDNIKEKTKLSPFAPENEKTNPDNFTTYMNRNKPITYTQTKKTICDWIVEKTI